MALHHNVESLDNFSCVKEIVLRLELKELEFVKNAAEF